MEESIAPPYDAPRQGRRRLLLFGILGLLGVWLLWEAVTWPDVSDLEHKHPTTSAFMEKYQGWGIFGAKKEVEHKWVAYSQISSNLKRAVIVSEDIRFFSHEGFDEKEIQAALQDAWEDKEFPRGASTITQQLAKNLWLSASYNPLRKVKEALLTRQLEKGLSKRRILELYLNYVEFGRGIYGAEAAARHYYGRSARSLSERQAAELAASLPRPKSWHPGTNSRGYQRKIRSIQRRMAKARWLRGEI